MNFDEKSSEPDNKKLVKFHKNKYNIETNVGVLVFAAIFIYLIGVSARYLTTHNISTYEVSYGSIIYDTAYTGIAIREELIYNSSESGYVQFYLSDGTRVSYDNIVYTISPTSIDIDSTSSYNLTSSEQDEILANIQSYISSYDNMTFYNSTDLISGLEFILNSSENTELLNELSELDATNTAINIYKSSDIGILSYAIDGYESLTADNFTADSFDRTGYSSSKVSTGENVTTNEVLYKLITDEEWSIIIEVGEDDIEAYEELSSIQVKFLSDAEYVAADIALTEKSGVTYAILTLDTGMIRYINDRFLNIELVLEDLEGYKIPISSVISQEFYKIPLEYLTEGGTSGYSGLLVVDEDNSVTFTDIDTYYKDSDYVYLLVSDLGEDLKIRIEDTSEMIEMSDKVDMDGVYVVNKGYAEYKLVTILTSSSEYYIVDDSMSYSISNYDHIALYGDSVSENAIIN